MNDGNLGCHVLEAAFGWKNHFVEHQWKECLCITGMARAISNTDLNPFGYLVFEYVTLYIATIWQQCPERSK
jgi:hypothetical protein